PRILAGTEPRGPRSCLPAVPLAIQQAEEDRVLDVALDIPSLAQQAFSLEAEPVEDSQRARVPRIDIRLEAAQVHWAESIVEQAFERLAHVPLLPVLAFQRVAELAAAVLRVDVEDGASSEEPLVLLALDAPLEA